MDIKIEEYLKIKQFRNYPFLKSINIKRKIGYRLCLYDIEIILSSENDDNVLLICQEVSNIKINYLEGFFSLYVDIENIIDKQIENSSYHILEKEEDAFSFYCKSFIIAEL